MQTPAFAPRGNQREGVIADLPDHRQRIKVFVLVDIDRAEHATVVVPDGHDADPLIALQMARPNLRRQRFLHSPTPAFALAVLLEFQLARWRICTVGSLQAREALREA